MRKINFDIKKPKLSLLITIIFVVLMLLGTSFAYFLVSGGTLLSKVETGKISVNYSEGNIIRNNNFIPLTDDEILEHATKLDFSVTNDGTAKTYVNIEFSDITIADELKSEDTKWSLYQDNNVIATGNFSNVTSSLSLSKNILFEINDTKNYTVYIWINENGGDQSSMQGKSLSAKMKVYANQRKSMDSRLADYKIYGDSFQSTLPYPYQSVEYIESTGTQYIDTKFIPNQDTSVETSIQYTTKTASNNAVFGTRERTNLNSYTMMLSADKLITSSMFFSGYGTENYQSAITGSYEIFKINKNKNDFYINDNLVFSQPSQEFSSPSNLVLFACYNVAKVEFYSKLKMYYTKILDNGNLIRNFIPCYNIKTNEIGMYDTVNGKFYTNAGTGTFLKGGDVAPTPDNPIDVVSLGENTKNLFDINSATISPSTNGNISDEIYTCNKGFYGSGVFLTISKPIEIDKTYTISFDYMPTNTNSLTAYVGFKKADGSGILNEYIHATALNEWSHFSVTKTITSEVEQKLQLQPSGNSIQYNNMNAKFKNIQIENNSNKTEYRPYRYIDVESRGKNLFNPTNAELTNVTLSNGTFTTLSITNEIDYYLPAGTYIVSGKQNTTKTIFFRKGKVESGIIGEVSGEQFSKTLTLTSDDYLRISMFNPDRIIEDIQIEKGENPTQYEPYVKSTTTIDLTGHDSLRKIGDVADYIDYKNGKIVRNIGKKVFDGTESLGSTGEQLTGYFTTVYELFSKRQGDLSDFISTHFENHLLVSKNTDCAWIGGSYNKFIYFRIDQSIATNNEELLLYFARQNTNGTPVTVYYQLAKPIIEDIDLPELPLNSGTTILTVNGTNQVNTFN